MKITLYPVRDLFLTILKPAGVSVDPRLFPEGTGPSPTQPMKDSSNHIDSAGKAFGWEIFGGLALRQGNWKLLRMKGQVVRAGGNCSTRWKCSAFGKLHEGQQCGAPRGETRAAPGLQQDAECRFLQHLERP